MRDVAVVSFASFLSPKSDLDEVEMLAPVIREAVARSGIAKRDIGFTVSGSCDYLGGRPFSFVMALDAVGAWPPIAESHVEMDGAWALYEAWVRLQHGDVDAALVYAFGRSTQGDLADVLAQQLDPYCVAPLSPDWVSLAGLQARALVDAGRAGSEMTRLSPPPPCDAASAIVLAAGDRAKRACARPAWIRGIDHRIEASSIGARDLSRSVSTEIAARHAGVGGKSVDVAELHATFAHEEVILKRALGLADDVAITPSRGPREHHAFVVAGLNRIGEAAERVMDGSARRAVAHATSGPCLQQNLVCVLEGAS
jgi:acetyl-CoA acetyltransferase